MALGSSYALWSADIFDEDDIMATFANTDWLQGQSFDTTRDVTPCEAVVALISLNALDLLRHDFYRRTNPLNQRSLLDLPIMLPQKYSLSEWVVGGHVFYDQTTRDRFTRRSDSICSYLNILDPNILDNLSSFIDIIREAIPGFELNPFDVFPLFANMTIQERRLGFMFHAMRRWNTIRFRFHLPFYYQESNYYLTEKEQAAIEDELGASEDQDKFASEHFIGDKIGFGDLRLAADFPVGKEKRLKVGAQVTIPTAFAIKKGLMGSSYCKQERGPKLDFLKLFELGQGTEEQQAQAQQMGTDFALAAVDHLSANLIEIPMGNNHHFGIGGYYRSKFNIGELIERDWAQKLQYKGHVSLELLLPAWERRYFKELDDSNRFKALNLNRSRNSIIDDACDDAVYARRVLEFMECQLTDKFFPFALDARVSPGIVFNSTSKIGYEGKRWGFDFGWNTWVMGPEKINKIKIPKDLPQDLNIKVAEKPLAYQATAFGTLFLKSPRKHDWYVSLNFGQTFSISGIGEEFSLSLNVEAHF